MAQPQAEDSKRKESPTPAPGGPPATRARVGGAEAGAARTFTTKTLGGSQSEVSLPGSADVGDLEAAVAKATGVGFCFSLLDASGKQLDDISAPLPADAELHLHVENASELCAAAQRVLKSTFRRGTEDPEKLSTLRLGSCRTLGSFPGSEWKEGGIESAISDIESDDETYDMYGSYDVCEFTLLDADGKRLRLVGVINNGDADSNTGMWGSVYLRPALQEVGTIRSHGDSESVWSFEDAAWYKAPSAPLPRCVDTLRGGGRNATTPLHTHLAHALLSTTPADKE